MADTELAKLGEPAIKYLEEIHEIMPKIEKRNRCSNKVFSSN